MQISCDLDVDRMAQMDTCVNAAGRELSSRYQPFCMHHDSIIYIFTISHILHLGMAGTMVRPSIIRNVSHGSCPG